MAQTTILVVDDEKEIAELRSLCEALVKDNQRLRESHDAQD